MTAPVRRIPVSGSYDVVVLGDGPAGILAASSAARNGASVLLVERYGFLGGMGTAAGVSNFCGLHANVFGEIRQVVYGLTQELLHTMQAMDGLNDPHLILGKIHAQAYDISAFKCAADQLVHNSGVKLLFHALATGIHCHENGNVEALILETKSGVQAVKAKVFIDCSGDADIAHWAGLPFEKGDNHGNMLYPTLMFKVGNVDSARAQEAWKTIPVLMDEAVANKEYSFPRRGAIIRPQKRDYEWRVNVTQLVKSDGLAVDGIDVESLSQGEREGREQILDYLNFLRAKAPGFENAYILDIAAQIGIRETRRVCGEYMLTRDDVLGCADFHDSIGVNGWPLEIHQAGDVLWEWPPIPSSRGYNQLPFRMLIPKADKGGANNILVAGRCASMTHEAQSAARVSGSCFVMGEAAGTAAALALQENILPAQLSTTRLQAQLIKQGAFLGQPSE